MSGDDDIERLLREIDATESRATTPSTSPGASPVPARRSSKDVVAPDSAPPGRVARAARTGVVAGAVCGLGYGALTLAFVGLPLIENPVSSGLGAFVGAFLTGSALSLRSDRAR